MNPQKGNAERLSVSKYIKGSQPPDCIHSDKNICRYAYIPINKDNIIILKDFLQYFYEENFGAPFFHLVKPERISDTEALFYGHDGSIIDKHKIYYSCHIQAEKEEDYWTQEWVDIFFFWRVIDSETEEMYYTEPLWCRYLHEEYEIDWSK